MKGDEVIERLLNGCDRLQAGLDASVFVKHQLLANWHHLGLNVARPNLRDLRVRQAISFAVDWARIERTVYHGLDRLAVSDIFPQSWAAPALPARNRRRAGVRLSAG